MGGQISYPISMTPCVSFRAPSPGSFAGGSYGNPGTGTAGISTPARWDRTAADGGPAYGHYLRCRVAALLRAVTFNRSAGF